MARSNAIDPSDDVGVLARAVTNGISRRIQERLVRDGFHDVRNSHRDVVFGLLAGDATVVELAGRLAVSAQAVSKTVTELERAGYVRRGRDADDKRARPLQLTAAGEQLVDALRRARNAETRDLARWLGTRDQTELIRLLHHAAEHVRGLPPR